MKGWLNWYLYLRKMGYPFFYSIEWAYYNNKYWYPEGIWPYDMKKRRLQSF